MEDDPDVALSRTLTLGAKYALPFQSVKSVLVDGYAESNSTTSSSSVASSGRSSPMSTSTATSHLYFSLEDEEEAAAADESARGLIRNFSSALHMDPRERLLYKRGSSHVADKDGVPRRRSTTDDLSKPEHAPKARERSPIHPHYTFPIRLVYPWAGISANSHPASAPVSAAESRRGSTLVSGLKCIDGVADHMDYDDRAYARPSIEPVHVGNSTESHKPDKASRVLKQEVPDVSNPPDSNTPDLREELRIPPRRRPEQQLTEDICHLVLQQAFGVDLQDLTFAGDALESVGRCLEELSSVVDSDRALGLAAPLRSVPAGDRQSVTPGEQSGEYRQNRSSRKSRGKRRANSNDNEDRDGGYGSDDQDDANSGGDDSSPARSKKIRIEPPDNRYPCPYRKRNPLRFNVRDHTTCATASFSDLTNLKRHIKLYHKQQARQRYVCFRCGVDKETRDQLKAHVQLPPDQICAVRQDCAVRQEAQNADPEEGITKEVEELLNERKSKTKIDTWLGLWQALFGGDDDVLSCNFEPPVEWDEVRSEFEGTRDNLKNRVQLESLTIKELRPEAQSYVAAHMEYTCWDYIGSVLSASRLQADYHCERQHKRRRNHKSSTSLPNPGEDGLLPPTMQRPILPKPGGAASASENGLPVGPNTAVIVSNGSSLSSSWETAISNVSSSNLLSASSSTSLATQALPVPVLPIHHKLPNLDLPSHQGSHPARVSWAGFVGDGDIGCTVDKTTQYATGTYNDAFPEYIHAVNDGEYALQDGLENLFGYGDYDDGIGLGDGVGSGQAGMQFDMGNPGAHYQGPS
jgi:hypothetical protein